MFIIRKKEILNKFQRKLKNMDFNVEKKEKFSITLKRNVAILFRIKGTLAGKDITISIAPAESNNYISTEFANHLVIPESNIREELDFWDIKQIEISGLQLNVGVIWSHRNSLLVPYGALTVT